MSRVIGGAITSDDGTFMGSGSVVQESVPIANTIFPRYSPYPTTTTARVYYLGGGTAPDVYTPNIRPIRGQEAMSVRQTRREQRDLIPPNTRERIQRLASDVRSQRLERQDIDRARGMTAEEIYGPMFGGISDRAYDRSTGGIVPTYGGFTQADWVRDIYSSVPARTILRVVQQIYDFTYRSTGRKPSPGLIDALYAWIVNSILDDTTGEYARALDLVESALLSGAVQLQSRKIDPAPRWQQIFGVSGGVQARLDQEAQKRAVVGDNNEQPLALLLHEGDVSVVDRPAMLGSMEPVVVQNGSLTYRDIPKYNLTLGSGDSPDCAEFGFVWQYDTPITESESPSGRIYVPYDSVFVTSNNTTTYGSRNGGQLKYSFDSRSTLGMNSVVYGFARVDPNVQYPAQTLTALFAEDAYQTHDIINARVYPIRLPIQGDSVIVDRPDTEGGPFRVEYGRPVSYYCRKPGHTVPTEYPIQPPVVVTSIPWTLRLPGSVVSQNPQVIDSLARAASIDRLISLNVFGDQPELAAEQRRIAARLVKRAQRAYRKEVESARLEPNLLADINDNIPQPYPQGVFIIDDQGEPIDIDDPEYIRTLNEQDDEIENTNNENPWIEYEALEANNDDDDDDDDDDQNDDNDY